MGGLGVGVGDTSRRTLYSNTKKNPVLSSFTVSHPTLYNQAGPTPYTFPHVWDSPPFPQLPPRETPPAYAPPYMPSPQTLIPNSLYTPLTTPTQFLQCGPSNAKLPSFLYWLSVLEHHPACLGTGWRRRDEPRETIVVIQSVSL